MDKKPPAKILRIHVADPLYKALKAASEEDGMSMSSFGRRILVRALRNRARDKSLQGLPDDPTTTGAK